MSKKRKPLITTELKMDIDKFMFEFFKSNKSNVYEEMKSFGIKAGVLIETNEDKRHILLNLLNMSINMGVWGERNNLIRKRVSKKKDDKEQSQIRGNYLG